MGQPTQRFKKSVSGSIGAGMKSVIGGDGRRFFVLEHKVSSKYHKAGEEQKIIVDQIEIGRDPQCAVRLEGTDPNDKMFLIVSRKHAAIEKDGDNWTLVHLSTTNSTFLNGRKLDKPGQKWYLQNGDEIQIAESGPKLGFKIPQGEKGLVKSLRMTDRLNLFRQQALRPYKHALTALSCLLLLISCVGGKIIYDQHIETEDLKGIVAETKEKWGEEKALLENALDSVKTQNTSLKDAIVKMTPRIEAAEKAAEEARKRAHTKINIEVSSDVIADALPYIFFIQTQKFVITNPDGQSITIQWTNGQNKDIDNMYRALAYTGTGFLTSDNRFITARHVAEGWYYWISGGQVNEAYQYLNYVANNGGRVVAHFIAVSSSGKQISFTSDQFKVNRSTDQHGKADDGSDLTVAVLNQTDWAYININGGNLKVNKSRSSNLKRSEHLYILGFPMGIGANSPTDITPMSSEAKTAHDGLQNGVIITTATTFEQGNSGGPVFALDENGGLEVIGIVSAGSGRSTGFVVPISAINK